VIQQLHSIEKLELKANDIRQDIIKMLQAAGSGHAAGPLGQAEIFTALYFNVLRHDPHNPDWEDRDILIQSNGHTVPVRYAAMAEAGYFPIEELQTLRKLGSRLQGHPERLKLPGLETTSGPLGCGLSQGAGIALALRMDKQTHRRVYVTTGDGELNEGNMWEAAMLIGKYKLNNLTAIVDRNNIQIDGPTEVVMPLEDLRGKWEAFGWHVLEIDGNDVEAVIDACNMAKAIVERPVVILAHTIPGKGVDFMEYDYHWHGYFVQTPGAPTLDKTAKVALKELRTLRGQIKSEAE
jgi:transketolase